MSEPSPRCYPGMLEFELLAEAVVRAQFAAEAVETEAA